MSFSGDGDKCSSFFVSYNPGVENEQSTALRLQTLAGLYGVVIHLPDRYGAIELKSSTKQRIADSVLFVMFSTKDLSKQVEEEVNHAISLGKKVLVFYDKGVGKKPMTKDIYEKCFDPLLDTPATVIDRVLMLGDIIESSESENKVAFAIVEIGLCLIFLWSLSKKE